MSKGRTRPSQKRMAEVSRLLKSRVRNLGKRQLTEQDFKNICQRQGVFVTVNDGPHMKWGGIYTTVVSCPIIILRPDAHDLNRAWTKFHELGHHLLHAGRLQALCSGPETDYAEAQYEADTFAALALFPTMDEQSAKALKFRLDLFKHFKL